MLRSLGISKIPIREGTRWRRAYDHEGELHDIEYRDGGIVVVPSEPKVVKDEAGNVVSVRVRSPKEAKALLKKLKPGFEADIQQSSTRIRLDQHSFGFGFEPAFGQVVAKMCIALATLLPGFCPDEVSETADLLPARLTRLDEVRRDYRGLGFDADLPLLSHRIHVERCGGKLHGRVVFFSSVQMYCIMRGRQTVSQDASLIGTLNVLTGDETFDSSPILGLSEAPFVITNAARDRGMAAWAQAMKEQIERAGVKGWNVELGLDPRSRDSIETPSHMNFTAHTSATSGTFRIDTSQPDKRESLDDQESSE